MAITAYSGLPGSGKSYGVVENVILPALKKGRRVWTNIPLNMELIEKEWGGLVTLYETKDIADDPNWFQDTFEAGATLVIDECWRLWATGMKANQMLEGHKSFLAEHRHMVGEDGNSTEIVYVTQDLAQIASYPRSLVETTYRAVKLTVIGASKKFRIDVYQGVATGPSPPEKNRVRQIFSSYKPDIYKYYTSQTMSDADGHGDETQTDSRINILNSKWILIGAPVLFVTLGTFIYFGFKDVSSMYGDATTPREEIAESGEPGVAPVKAKKVQRHFYSGLDVYIAYQAGWYPYADYTIGLVGDDYQTTIKEDQLAAMGYHFIAFSECYGQLRKGDSSLDVFCRPPMGSDENQQENSEMNDWVPSI